MAKPWQAFTAITLSQVVYPGPVVAIITRRKIASTQQGPHKSGSRSETFTPSHFPDKNTGNRCLRPTKEGATREDQI
jgi:hypothetical protein